MHRHTLVLTIVAWIVLLVAMTVAPSKNAFWGVGLLIGLIFGGVPTAERPLLLSLVPPEDAGRFFSLMLLSPHRAAAIAGPFIWGITVDVLEPKWGTGFAYRAAVLTVAIMFAASLALDASCPRAYADSGSTDRSYIANAQFGLASWRWQKGTAEVPVPCVGRECTVRGSLSGLYCSRSDSGMPAYSSIRRAGAACWTKRGAPWDAPSTGDGEATVHRPSRGSFPLVDFQTR